jgi:hypothetical protein
MRPASSSAPSSSAPHLGATRWSGQVEPTGRLLLFGRKSKACTRIPWLLSKISDRRPQILRIELNCGQASEFVIGIPKAWVRNRLRGQYVSPKFSEF